MHAPFRSGHVALAGRPNAGKSTLLNAIIGWKVAIASPRRQTTRHRIAGIRTTQDSQVVFTDTPGVHAPQHLLGEYLLNCAKETIRDSDLVAFVVVPGFAPGDDREILSFLRQTGKPLVLVVNKTDASTPESVSETIRAYRDVCAFNSVFRVSAKKGRGVEEFLSGVVRLLPEGPPMYPGDQDTDQIERDMVAEFIREKVIANTSDEVPHAAAVEVTGWAERKTGVVAISANIYVEREGQKGIIIGDNGQRLKKIGTEARREIEGLLQTKVFLELWVKVRRGWRNDRSMLKEMGYR